MGRLKYVNRLWAKNRKIRVTVEEKVREIEMT